MNQLNRGYRTSALADANRVVPGHGLFRYNFLDNQELKVLRILTDFFASQGGQWKIAETIDQELSSEAREADSIPWRGEFYKQGISEVKKTYEDLRAKDILKDAEENIIDFLEKVLSDKKKSFLKNFLGEVARTSVAIAHSFLWSEISFARNISEERLLARD